MGGNDDYLLLLFRGGKGIHLDGLEGELSCEYLGAGHQNRFVSLCRDFDIIFGIGLLFVFRLEGQIQGRCGEFDYRGLTGAVGVEYLQGRAGVSGVRYSNSGIFHGNQSDGGDHRDFQGACIGGGRSFGFLCG